jgi:hypothetical protein
MTKGLLKYFWLVLVLVSCSEENVPAPDYVIAQDKFTNIMVQVHLIDANINQRFVKLVDSTDQSLSYYKAMFEAEGITRTDFDSTFAYYARHPKKMDEIYDSVQSKLKAMAEELQKHQEGAEKQ